MFQPVILAGGTGSRLWPLSRELMPKQFLKLCGDSTMMQATVKRLQNIISETPLLVCNEDHRFIAAEQLRQIGQLKHNIILEPAGRSTAPSVALAAIHAIKDGKDPLLLVLPADHLIQDIQAFQGAITDAVVLADANQLVTFGITPTAAETGFGYIRRGAVCSPPKHVYKVAEFVEKPNRELAAKYVQSGEYYWNSGIFMFKASVYLAELQRFRPDIFACCEAAMSKPQPDLDFIRVDHATFLASPADSIDFAIMEKTANAVVVPISADWSDIGSWSALWDISNKDLANNVQHGQVFHHNSRHNYVYAETGIVATVGIENTVIIQTKDAVLVAAKDQVQHVKDIVQQLKAAGRTEHRLHREVYRPWGKYDNLDSGDRYQVKRLCVMPGESLSMQLHHHRAEHWIVVQGTAKVTINGKQQLLDENQSVYIPIGAVHCLENPGATPLQLIEVQSGDYLGEDDIVRFSDRYGRN